ncbi:unnamed protein product [Lota lota]
MQPSHHEGHPGVGTSDPPQRVHLNRKARAVAALQQARASSSPVLRATSGCQLQQRQKVAQLTVCSQATSCHPVHPRGLVCPDDSPHRPRIVRPDIPASPSSTSVGTIDFLTEPRALIVHKATK